jgi:type IV pilus assembly protein PilO
MAASITSVAKPVDEPGNFFSRLAWYYQMGLFLILAILLIWAVDAMLFSDKRAETLKTRDQIETLKRSNSNGNIIKQNLAATEQALKEKETEIEHLRDLLPDQGVEISRVYDSIKEYMRAERLDLGKFEENPAVPADYYTAQPIQVEVTGPYDNLGRFFSRLGFYSRIVSVTDVDIRRADEKSQAVGRTINASFKITAYFISPENLDKLTMKKPAAPAAKAAK